MSDSFDILKPVPLLLISRMQLIKYLETLSVYYMYLLLLSIRCAHSFCSTLSIRWYTIQTLQANAIFSTSEWNIRFIMYIVKQMHIHSYIQSTCARTHIQMVLPNQSLPEIQTFLLRCNARV